MKFILSLHKILSCINNNYGNLLLLAVTVIGLGYAYNEYKMKTLTAVVPELVYEIKGERWLFHVQPVNLGNFAAHARIEKAVLKVGDEIYPTEFNKSLIFVVPTTSSESTKKIIIPIGDINEIGRNRINRHEYKINRVEIEIKILSKPIGKDDFIYSSQLVCEVDVKGKEPMFRVVKEETEDW